MRKHIDLRTRDDFRLQPTNRPLNFNNSKDFRPSFPNAAGAFPELRAAEALPSLKLGGGRAAGPKARR
jgi:hypothetical protein